MLTTLLVAVGIAAPAQALVHRGPQLLSPASHAIMDYPEFHWMQVPGAVRYEIQIAQDRRFATKDFTYSTWSTHYILTRTLPAGSYWWRVRVTQPFRSSWSVARVFTRRWGNGGARPDHVTVMDFSSDPGLQAPMNALQISWDPVQDASYYVVQLDRIKGSDPDEDVTAPYSTHFEPPAAECITTHTILTPNQSQLESPSSGIALISDPAEQDCTIDSPGTWVMRVRAVDRTVDGAEVYSLWSDEARGPGQAAPGPTIFTIGPRLSEDTTRTPAVLTGPENGTKFTDTPVLTWNPKMIGAPASYCDWTATDPCYKVVIALDQDFTTEVGHFYTTNTRFVPLPRIPEDNAERAYYWYVVPCYSDPDGKDYCLSSNTVVNRPSIYRNFVKLSPHLDTNRASRRAAPFTVFKWSTAMSTARRSGRSSESVGGVDYYEFETRLPGNPWPDDQLYQAPPTISTGAQCPARTYTYVTDTPELIPEGLSFNTPYQWRVRVVDGSGQTRPWSIARDVTTMRGAPGNPLRLRAHRTKSRLTLSWQAPRTVYFPIEGYTVLYSMNGKRWTRSGDTGALHAKFKINRGTRYWFAVYANSCGGASMPSKVVVGK